MSIFIRILIILVVFGTAGWLVFSVSSGIGDENEIEHQGLVEIKSLKENYKKKEKKTEESESKTEKKESLFAKKEIENQALEEIEIDTTKKEPIKKREAEEKHSLIISNKKIKEDIYNSKVEVGKLDIEIINWNLMGEFKNILVVTSLIKNGMKDDLINKGLTFKCSGSDGSNLKKHKKISIASMKEKSFNIIVGYVDPKISDVSCSYEQTKKRIRTVKTVRKEIKSTDIEKTFQNKKEAEIVSPLQNQNFSNSGEDAEDDFPLPSF